jgi:nitrogen fixation protein FixH
MTMREATFTPRPITGLKVFLYLFAFFAVVAAVNGTMIFAAVKTFGGLETESSYKAGLAFAREVAAAQAQDARHWRVDAVFTPNPDGTTRFEVTARDAAQAALAGLDAAMSLHHPTDRRLDRAVALGADGPGRFQGSAPAPAGQWDLVIELSRGGERLFRSRQRITLH